MSNHFHHLQKVPPRAVGGLMDELLLHRLSGLLAPLPGSRPGRRIHTIGVFLRTLLPVPSSPNCSPFASPRLDPFPALDDSATTC